MDSTCYASRNLTDGNISSNLTDLYLLGSVENLTISSDCALANQQVLEYANCFTANTDAGASFNYTAQVVKLVNLDGSAVSAGLLEEIFCKPAIEIKNEKEGKMILLTPWLSKLSSFNFNRDNKRRDWSGCRDSALRWWALSLSSSNKTKK